MLEKVRYYLSEIKQYLEFGIITSFKLVIRSSRLSYNERVKYQQKIKYDYIRKSVKSIDIQSADLALNENSGPIWFCWWQGEKEMPSIIKTCWIRLNNSIKNRKIVFIDKDNYSKYVSIEENIMIKFKKGIITLTHFSDILRCNLLYANGGIWVDSSVFINSSASLFFTQPLLTLSIGSNDAYITNGRWSSFLFGISKGNALFKYLVDCMNLWWSKYNNMIDYYMIDYIIAIAYNNNEQVKNMIDNNAVFCKDLYFLQRNLTAELSQSHIEGINTIPFSKLTWKYPTPSNPTSLSYYLENLH